MNRLAWWTLPQRIRHAMLGAGLFVVALPTGAAAQNVARLSVGRDTRNLYTRLGFRMTPPYYDLSDELRNWLVFMELDLHRPNPLP